MQAIAAALKAMAGYIEDHATGMTSDAHLQASDQQRAVKGDKVRMVARDLRILADSAETRKLAYRDYEALKDRLYAFGFALPPNLTQDIATAFREAEGPMKPRGPGWLKGQGGA